MSMTLTDMTNIATLARAYANSANTSGMSGMSGTSGTSATADPMTQALDVANKRISAQISQTDVQLSSYGQIKSGFASVQSAGKTLTTLSANASAADVTKAAQSLVDAYNSTTNAVATAVNGNGKSPGALANDSLARLSGNDLRRVVTSGSGIADLQKIGISVNSNGSLSVDSTALGKALAANPNAVKGVLSKLGQQANTTASTELSSGGAVGSAVNSLNSQAKNLAAKQTQEQNLAASAQAAVQQNSALTSNFGGVSAGIAAYMKTFSL